MKKNISSKLYMIVSLFSIVLFIQSAYAVTVCTVSSDNANNWGKCYRLPNGDFDCSPMVTTGNPCNGTVTGTIVIRENK